MANLFLSYSRKDVVRVRRFAEWLERQRHEVWRDDDDIGAGASFSSEIEKALHDCDAVLVLWSTESVQSAWVRDEAGYARDAAKLIPLSLDGAEPPLGFRQFQSIDLAAWKGRGEPPGADRISRAIGRIADRPSVAEPAPRPADAQATRTSRWIRSAAVAAIVLLGLAGIASFFLLRSRAGNDDITFAVAASPTSSDGAAAADYANVAAADLAAFLPTRFDRAKIIAPAEIAGRTDGYSMLIAAGRHGGEVDASLTMSGPDQAILWSKSWSVPDASAADLREEVSSAASQAALCLTDAKGGKVRLDQPALGLYISGCVGVADPEQSNAELLAIYERVVKLAPDFPRAWGALAIGRSIFAEAQQARAGTPDSAAIESARQAIATARKLDPQSGLVYVAEWHLAQDDPLRGLALLDKGVDVAPGEPLLHMRRSDSLASVGRMTESVEEAHRAVELDPLSSFARSIYIDALSYAGQSSRAKADIAEARKKWPRNADIDDADFRFQYAYGDAGEAETLLPRSLDNSDAVTIPLLKVIAARLNPTPVKIDDAIATLRFARQTDPHDRNRYLLALGLFGKVDEAYRLLADPNFQRSVDSSILFRPEFARVRSDPRFMQIAARLGLARYWRKSGHWPDFCTNEQIAYDCKVEAANYRA